MRRDEKAVLVERKTLSPDTHLLFFESESLASSFVPGQFTMLRLPGTEPLLRRPYSFCDRLDSRFTLLVKEAGRGTRALARLSVGEVVDCLGPLGSRFTMPEPESTPVIVAGGVGIAPFVGFCRRLAASNKEATVLLGGRREHDLYLREDFEALGMCVRCTTEDGSFGHAGRVTDLLPELLEKTDSARLYSCGPTGMLLNTATVARRYAVPHEVSLERRMGCGMGCCLGCVVFVAQAERPSHYVRSCTEGPVFDADSVVWERDPFPM